MTDTSNQIKNKINRHGFSGGQETEEEHRKYGGDTEVDVAYQYLSFFLDDDDELAKIGEVSKREGVKPSYSLETGLPEWSSPYRTTEGQVYKRPARFHPRFPNSEFITTFSFLMAEKELSATEKGKSHSSRFGFIHGLFSQDRTNKQQTTIRIVYLE